MNDPRTKQQINMDKKLDSPIVMMIDIGTLSLRPDAFVTQFGFCIANWRTCEMLYAPMNIWMKQKGQSGTIDFDTVKWWIQQDKAVSKSVFSPPRDTVFASPEWLFSFLKSILAQFPDMTVWGSPAMFDLPILTHMWNGRKPWMYNYERDMMTLYKLVDPTGALKPEANAMAHDAASDAEWQMKYLMNLLNMLDGIKSLAMPRPGLTEGQAMG